MPENHDEIAQMRAITISREYGSGGGEVAQRLAQRLGWELVDHEILVRVAQELNITELEAEEHDERGESLVNYLISSMRVLQPAMFTLEPQPVLTNTRLYHEALTKVVEAAIARGHVIIVGRGSQVLLAGRRDVFHTRIVAPFDLRVQYVMQREGLGKGDAGARIQMKDHDRERYLQTQYRRNPNDSALYDLIINSGILDLDTVTDLITLGVERKARRLHIPTNELGPKAGLTRYPGQPGDIRPPTS